jgi:putative ABC transport system permease protein
LISLRTLVGAAASRGRDTVNLFQRLLRRIRILLRGERVERELSDELRAHIELETADLLDAGWDPAAARREAFRRFGGEERTKERVRDARGGRWLADLVQDVRYGARSLRKSPGFAASALLVLALGIGATTALFSVVNGVLLRPLPYPEPEQLVRAWSAFPALEETQGDVSYLDFFDWSERTETLSAVGAWVQVPPDATLVRGGEPAQQIPTAWIGGNFFDVMGVPPMLGRSVTPDDVETSRPVAVLSEGAWRRLFGADAGIISRTITLDFQSVEVVGVMPEGFAFPDSDVDVWVPMTLAFVGRNAIVGRARGIHALSVVGRLADGVTAGVAEGELSRIAADLAETYPDPGASASAATVESLRDTLVGGVRTALWSLLGAAGFFAFLATATLANLLLVRGSGRQREIALRRGLGASTPRIARQLVTEMVALAALGGGLGLGLAWLLIGGLRAGAADILPRVGSVRLDAASVWAAVAVTGVVALLPGIFSALRLVGRGASGGLGGWARQVGEDLRGVRQRRWLVAGEMALAVVLLIGAGLLVRSLVAMARVDPGFTEEGAVAMTLTIPAQKYGDPASIRAVPREILTGLRALPGVTAAAATSDLPILSQGEGWGVIVPDLDGGPTSEGQTAQRYSVTEDAFDALGVRLVRGRALRASDGANDPLVTVVNETMVRQFFRGQDPIGLHVSNGGDESREVVGVVRDVRHGAPSDDLLPAFYVPMEQDNPRPRVSFVVRAAGDPLGLVGPMREVARAVDPDLPVSEIVPLERLAFEVTARPRVLAAVMSGFAVLATILAILGVYGVLAHTVRARSREIGLRSALGASRGRTIRHVIAGGMGPALVGLAVGLGAAALLGRFLQSLLFGVEPSDPVTFAGAGFLLAASAALACLLPALWAARVDPMTSLRAE